VQQRWDSLKRALRYNYLKIMRLKASTHAISLGLAIGIFVGFLPIIPFQTVVALAIAFVLRGSAIPAAVGTWISNPVNLIPFYTMLYYVGRWFMPMEAPDLDFSHLELKSMIEQGWGLVVVMFTGGFILGIPGAFLTYVLTFRAVNRYRQKRMIRLIRKYRKKKAARDAAAGILPGGPHDDGNVLSVTDVAPLAAAASVRSADKAESVQDAVSTQHGPANR